MTTETVNYPEIFTNEKFGSIRVILREGEPWLVAKDVCTCLGLDNVTEALRNLDVDEKITLSNPDGNPRAGIPLTFNLVNEPGFYSLVFRSRKPEAKEFKRWVTHEVLPSIRKTGQYSIAQSAPALPDFANPAEAARAWANEYEAKQKALALVEEQKLTIEAQEIALGNNRDWKAVTAIPWLKEEFADTSASACRRIGKTLAALSRARGMEIRKAEDDRWGLVNVYHLDVIDALKTLLKADKGALKDIRRKKHR